MRLGGGAITCPFFSERHVAVIPLDKMKLCMRLDGGAITFPFFSERHITVIPLDKTKLCMRLGGGSITFSFLSDTSRLYRSMKRYYLCTGVAAASYFRSCLSNISRVYCSMNRNCVYNVMQVRGGIIIPFISERHAAAISLEKPQLCVYGLAAGTSTANVVLQKIGFSVLTTGFEMRAAGAKICISGVGKEIWNSRKYSLAERKVISMTVCAQNFPRPCRADDRSSAFFNLKIDFPGTPPPPPLYTGDPRF